MACDNLWYLESVVELLDGYQGDRHSAKGSFFKGDGKINLTSPNPHELHKSEDQAQPATTTADSKSTKTEHQSTTADNEDNLADMADFGLPTSFKSKPRGGIRKKRTQKKSQLVVTKARLSCVPSTTTKNHKHDNQPTYSAEEEAQLQRLWDLYVTDPEAYAAEYERWATANGQSSNQPQGCTTPHHNQHNQQHNAPQESDIAMPQNTPKHIRFDDDGDAGVVAEAPNNTTSTGTSNKIGAGSKDDELTEAQKFKQERAKYFHQRYRLFSRFDEGVQLDSEGWYSVTPEAIAAHIARRCQCTCIVDAFCGVGGNTIQFALAGMHVIAIDLSRERLDMAKHNAEIYGVADFIDFVHGDFFEVMPALRGVADGVFLSPPWGGPTYIDQENFDIDTMPVNGTEVFEIARRITPNIAYLLPRNVDLVQVVGLAGEGNLCEVEKNFVNHKLKTVTVYYGAFVGTAVDA